MLAYMQLLALILTAVLNSILTYEAIQSGQKRGRIAILALAALSLTISAILRLAKLL